MSYEDYLIRKKLENVFYNLTKDFDIDNWRECRTPEYWESDKMEKIDALEHKIKCVLMYKKKNKL